MSSPPVVLVHGWAGSYARTWAQTPLVPLLEDAGRHVIGVDLLGHGTAPKPHDPEAYADLTQRIEEALPDEPVDAVGFSLGAITLLHLAMRRPDAFRSIVFAGIGENVFRQERSTERIVAALRGEAPEDDVFAGVFFQQADQPDNDLQALIAVMERIPVGVEPEQLATITCPCLVAIGDQDFAGPGDPLVAALPNATLAVLRRTDHFATPESFAFIDATLDFLGAQPG